MALDQEKQNERQKLINDKRRMGRFLRFLSTFERGMQELLLFWYRRCLDFEAFGERCSLDRSFVPRAFFALFLIVIAM